MTELKTGRVIRTDAKVCHVEVDGQVLLAAPRGILFASSGSPLGRSEQKNPVAVGDLVEVDPSSSPASLERVLPRRNSISRIASSHDPREQVLAANVDQFFVLGSVKKPLFSSNRTDRILAACVWNEIPARLILNKIDLAEEDEVESLRRTYEKVPIPVIPTSAKDGRGVENLRAMLKDKVSVFYGPSGAGKSSLLNRLQPGLGLKVGKISKYWDGGRHTTAFAQMHALDFGGSVVDTPGIRVFRLWGVKPEVLRDLFPEFVLYQERCKFTGCIHDHEPDCAVFDAVDRGELAASRYASYVEMLDEMRKAPPVEEDGEPEE